MTGQVHPDATAAIAFLSLIFLLTVAAAGMLVVVARSNPTAESDAPQVARRSR